ncbi:hypothetical protein CAter282_3959 [Collimonas arenae]|uniref:Uncharacterized protein n=1 Tax=Collimonas arenae TaxID=279058 RepID=A0A127QND7_9BURK|nr:hypothetical protein CAter10_4315 [Collimonas arenae]AMP11628.1 hypothetical protein CAter282_3959 [Collimonas arenae]
MGTADYSSAQSILLVLMNSAPAELLHPLIDAALQPSLAGVCRSTYLPRSWAKKRRRLRQRRNSIAETLCFSQRKRRQTRLNRGKRRQQIRTKLSLTVH